MDSPKIEGLVVIAYRGHELVRYFFPGSREVAMHNATATLAGPNPMFPAVDHVMAFWAFMRRDMVFCLECSDRMEATVELKQGIQAAEDKQRVDDEATLVQDSARTELE